jgi:hypothetical protein
MSFQATSPVNPAETCLTPPPEVTASQLECEDVNTSSTAAAVCGTSDRGSTPQQTPVTVQDASNQTDTPPVSEDENCCDSGPIQEKLHTHDLQVSRRSPKLSHYSPCRHQGGEVFSSCLILNLGTRWGWVFSITPSPGKDRYPLYWRLGGPQSWFGRRG